MASIATIRETASQPTWMAETIQQQHGDLPHELLQLAKRTTVLVLYFFTLYFIFNAMPLLFIGAVVTGGTVLSFIWEKLEPHVGTNPAATVEKLSDADLIATQHAFKQPTGGAGRGVLIAGSGHRDLSHVPQQGDVLVPGSGHRPAPAAAEVAATTAAQTDAQPAGSLGPQGGSVLVGVAAPGAPRVLVPGFRNPLPAAGTSSGQAVQLAAGQSALLAGSGASRV